TGTGADALQVTASAGGMVMTSAGSIAYDGGTTDRTTDFVTMDLDVNSASVDGLYIDLDIGTALSAAEVANAINIDVTGLAGDDVTSLLNGILLTGDTTSAGLVTAVNLAGAWDNDLTLQNGAAVRNSTNNDVAVVENGRTLTMDFDRTAGVSLDSASLIEVQSTANGAGAVELESTLGGINILASGAGTGEDIVLTATGSSITASATEAVVDAVTLFANAEGGSVAIRGGDTAAAIPAEGGNDVYLGAEDDVIIDALDDVRFTMDDDFNVTLAAAGNIVLDATTDNTTTTGVIDMDVDAGNAAVDALNIDLAQTDGAGAAVDATAIEILLTADDADGDMFGMTITGAATANAAAGSYEAGLVIDNQENNAGSMPDGILITATNASAITDAIDASDAEIDNALNVGTNNIAITTGTIGSNGAAVINFANFDVAGSGTMTLGNSGDNDVMVLNSDNTTTNNQIDIRPANTSGTLIVSQYDAAATLTGALVGLNLDLDTNVTPAAGGSNMTGILLAMDDNGASTSIGLDIDGAVDFGIDLAGLTSGTDIRLSNNVTLDGSGANELTLNATILPSTASARDLGGASNEWDDIFVGDDNGLNLGLDQDAELAYDETTDDRVELTGTGASLYVEDRLGLGRQTFTMATGGAATENLTPTQSYVEVTGQDNVADLVQIQTGSAKEGDLLIITNLSATTVSIDQTATTKLSGGGDIALTQYDVMMLVFDGTNWLQVAQTTNNS
ncbi:MAG: hypothetical protein AAB647_01945, partial [Patescibacteria group bacterium]